ncbi:MAG: class I SAM-dependent methyltransferase [bacterium]|nr:class I SAM-dependent methyltransferase [bacterium]
MSRSEKVRNVYRWCAKFYDLSRKIWNPFFASQAEKVFVQILRFYGQDVGAVLDVGVGTGLNIQRFMDNKIVFCSYEGIDLTPEMIVVAKQKFHEVKNLTFREGDITKIEITRKYDTIVSTLVFCHLERQDEVVQKLLRVLRPNGLFLLMFFTEKVATSWVDRLAGRFYQSIFQCKPVPREIVAKFPVAGIKKHFPCLGGQISIFVFRA